MSDVLAPSARSRVRRRLAALATGAALLLPLSASAWWNQEWSYRKPIKIEAGAAGADLKADLADVPVLIRLHEGVFKFSDANPDGSDLRFVAGDDKTPLRYHVEKFDAVFNLAYVWVSVPTVKAGAATDLWMYYGNRKAGAASDARGSYDPDQVLVYHFGERGVPAADSTGYANNSSTIAATDDAGAIGTAAKFDGRSLLQLPASPSLAVAAGGALTWSAWIKPASAGQTAVVYARHDGPRSLRIGLAGGVPYVAVSGDDGVEKRSAATQPLADGWHHLAVTGGTQVQLFVDGIAGPVLATGLPTLNSVASLGADNLAAAGAPPVASEGFSGALDELDLAKVARDPAYLQLQAGNQGAGDKLIGFGADEQLSSWSSGYLGIILHSVTLDGWVIIGILVVMAFISWGVMAGKTRQINRVTRGNREFLALFRSTGGDFSALNHLVAGTAAAAGVELSEEQRLRVQGAPLFHMFSAGIDELRGRLGGDGRHGSNYLSAQSIEAIRASLDSSLATELEALNDRMVLLTIAISGGPFLGLLGTVVGVMITFAAIAASGDVNVNAIAPGISAALVATVAGLIVAIPALFGYNYLITRINQAGTAMQVFLDAFVARMAESYDAPRELRAMAD